MKLVAEQQAALLDQKVRRVLGDRPQPWRSAKANDESKEADSLPANEGTLYSPSPRK